MRTFVVIIAALALGALGFYLLFADSGALALAVGFAFFGGAALLLGYAHPPAWWAAGLLAWGGVLLGALGLTAALRGTAGPRYVVQSLSLLLVPLALSLAAGAAGARLREGRDGREGREGREPSP